MILSNPLRTGKNHIIYPNFSNCSFNGGSGDRFLIRFLKKKQCRLIDFLLVLAL